MLTLFKPVKSFENCLNVYLEPNPVVVGLKRTSVTTVVPSEALTPVTWTVQDTRTATVGVSRFAMQTRNNDFRSKTL